MSKTRIWSYENRLLIMMSLANGVVALDRLAVNFLAKPIKDEFNLSNTQLGLLASALSLVIAVSGFLLASLADATRRRKLVLVVTLVGFSIFSALTGLARSFGLLLGSRMLLGLAEGPICPVAQSVVAIESSPDRRGFNMGIMQNLGAAVVGAGLGPIVFTQIAAHFGWRSAFYLSCLPGLILAAVILMTMRPLSGENAPATPALAQAAKDGSLWDVLKSRNILLCILISGLFSGWLLVQNIFLALYLQTHDGLSLTGAGWLISLTGAAMAISGAAIPALSDRIGRRPALAMITTFGVIAPLATLYVPAGGPWLGAALFVGWFGAGAGPLYVAIIPAESVGARHLATAVAISLAAGELIGGVASPFIAGRLADAFGLAAPFWFAAGAAAVCGVLSLFLLETAPRKVKALAAAIPLITA